MSEPKQAVIGKRNKPWAALKQERGIVLVIVMMTMVIFLAITGAALLLGGQGLKTSASYRTGTQTFYAADAGVALVLNQVSDNQANSTKALPTTTITMDQKQFSYSSPQGQFNGVATQAGYSIAVGTVYNAAGYAFYGYQFDITGTGPSAARRRVEVVAEYGPVPR